MQAQEEKQVRQKRKSIQHLPVSTFPCRVTKVLVTISSGNFGRGGEDPEQLVNLGNVILLKM